MSDMAKNLIVWLVIAVVLMSVFNSFGPGDSTDRQTSYTQFINEVNQGQIREVKVERSGVITGVKRSGDSFETVIPGGYDEKLLDDLIAQSRTDAEAYEEFLRQAEELVRKLAARQPDAGVPASLHGNAEAATIFNNLDSIPATTFKYPTDDEYRAALALGDTGSQLYTGIDRGCVSGPAGACASSAARWPSSPRW